MVLKDTKRPDAVTNKRPENRRKCCNRPGRLPNRTNNIPPLFFINLECYLLNLEVPVGE